MKPLIYFDKFEVYGDDKVMVKKETLAEIFDEVYQAGYDDGKRDYKYSISNPFTTYRDGTITVPKTTEFTYESNL